MNQDSLLPIMLAVLLSAMSTTAYGVTPHPEEFFLCRSWCDAVLGTEQERAEAPYLEVLQEDVPDSVSRGRSWRGGPYRIGEKTYTHGIGFNSVKRLRVHLGRPARQFAAEVGLENNDDTVRGAAMGEGSVTFHVFVQGNEVASTPVMRLKDPAVQVAVALNDADEFEIAVGNGGDGRGWDQAVWGDATVLMADGTSIRLQDLPWKTTYEKVSHPFSFHYGGTPVAALLESGKWTRERRDETQAGLTRRTIQYRDPDTGLVVRTEATLFDDFPAVEWVVYLKNEGASDTPLIEGLQACDTPLLVPALRQSTLHWAKGGVASFNDFAPREETLKADAPFRLQPGGGRSSSQVLPFFNVEGDTGGVVAAIGWSGEWAAEFLAGPTDCSVVRAGMAHTHLVLHPGEEIRTPRVLLLFYSGDRWRGQNLLRQFLLRHHRPQRNGQPLTAPITCGNWGATRAEVHLDNVRKIIEKDLPIEYYWIDAEWFGEPGGPWWKNTGYWEVKKDVYPEGFAPISTLLRDSGRELLLWFEPERVVKDTPWYRDHHDWLLDTGGDNALLNLGNPEARRFLTDFISSKVDEFGLGCYRQDFNIDPLPFWQAADSPDRQGITEIRYIEGLYAFWDELLARHPGLIIDNCASGGRRIDLETVGRATPFWRTDGPRDPIAHQCHSFGLLPWVPLSATSVDHAPDDYDFRSGMCSALCLNWWVAGDRPTEYIPEDFPFAWAKHTLEQYLDYRKYYYGDFYPLTPYSQGRDIWLAYQLDRPDLGEGIVVVLKRPDSPYEAARFPLWGLDPGAMYRITNLDSKEGFDVNGQDLVHSGLSVSLRQTPDSALLVYRTSARANN